MAEAKQEPFSVWRALEDYFAGDGWATFHEVRRGTGFVNDARSCDSWPSISLSTSARSRVTSGVDR
jgi:hypothetical protein